MLNGILVSAESQIKSWISLIFNGRNGRNICQLQLRRLLSLKGLLSKTTSFVYLFMNLQSRCNEITSSANVCRKRQKKTKKRYFLPASITKNWKSLGCGGNKTSEDVTRPLIYSSYSSGQPQFCVELKDKRSHMYIKLFVALDKDSPLWNVCLK